MKVNIVRLPHGAGLDLPSQGTPLSAGFDLSAAVDSPLEIKPRERVLVPTGFSIALPAGYEAQIRSRSGLSFRNGIIVLNSPATIDADYRGELKVPMLNVSDESFIIERGMRFSQMVINKVESVTWLEIEEHTDLEEMERGAKGFGSTGIHQRAEVA